MQAEIWRAASHSGFYARYFRVFPGFLGSKSFLNFFKKRVLGAVFTPQSSFRRTRRAVSASPPHALHPRIFEDFSPHTAPPSSQTVRWLDGQVARQSGSKLPKAVTPEKDRKTPTRHPHLRRVITSGDIKLLETTKKPRGEPRGFSGAVDET